MVRSTLRKSFLKYPTNKNNKLQQGKESLCQPTKKNEKNNYFENIDTKNTSHSKVFWKTVKQLLSNKCRIPGNISIVKGNHIISDNPNIADVFN